MNRLAAILPADNVLVTVDASSKKRAFEHAGLLFENHHQMARALVTDNLFARERLGSKKKKKNLKKNKPRKELLKKN